MSIGLMRVLPALLLVLIPESSATVRGSIASLFGIGAAACIAENELPPLAVALGSIS
jgi:hypothetical protein